MVGSTLNHYRVIGQLGSGGMGDVYLAEDTSLDRQVALKVLPTEMAQDPERLARFEREAKAIAALDHPSIVTIYTIEQADDVRFITMQLVEGRTVEQIIEQEGADGLPLRRVFEIGAPLAEAISVAHDRGITHRDLKPGNVMVTDDGRVMVLDFGLAKLRETGSDPDDETRVQSESLTSEGKIMGTVAYMSPEQAEGKPVDQRTDIFALGVLLYEMSTGRRPFRGDTKMSILTSIIRDTPPPVTELKPDLPRHVGRIIKHCLEKDPDRRFQSAKDLRNELDQLREELESGDMDAAAGETSAASAPSLKAPEAAAVPATSVPAETVGIDGSQTGATARSKAVAVGGARPFLRSPWLPAISAIAVLVLAGAWLLRLQAEARRVAQAAAGLVPLATEGRIDEVYEGVLAAELDLDDPRAEELAAVAAGTLRLMIEPAGAAVSATRVEPIDEFASRQTSHKLQAETVRRLVAGQYLLSASSPGFVPVRFLVDLTVDKEITVARTLAVAEATRGEMVLVDEGPSPVADGVVVAAFLIDKHEVTNREYLEFVTAGGYREAGLWPEAITVAGNPLPWAEAMRLFVDRTSLPGPRAWSGGRYPDGTEAHPVTDISWYEAAAFANWKGKQIPNRDQWWRAAIGDGGQAFPWGNDVRTFDLRANFGLTGTAPVGQYTLGVSPYGALDMAGNVREWLADPGVTDRLPAAGGSWQDPTYMFDPGSREAFPPEYASDALGFRLVIAPRPAQ